MSPDDAVVNFCFVFVLETNCIFYGKIVISCQVFILLNIGLMFTNFTLALLFHVPHQGKKRLNAGGKLLQ